jgi:hypothetical protein
MGQRDGIDRVLIPAGVVVEVVLAVVVVVVVMMVAAEVMWLPLLMVRPVASRLKPCSSFPSFLSLFLSSRSLPSLDLVSLQWRVPWVL